MREHGPDDSQSLQDRAMMWSLQGRGSAEGRGSEVKRLRQQLRSAQAEVQRGQAELQLARHQVMYLQ